MALLCLTTTIMAKKSETVTLRLVETSDVHGAFFPYDFIERKPMRGTLARVSTYINRQRKEPGQHLILLDNGDILQGQPTCYYYNYIKTDEQNIAAQVVNYLRYDAENIGNHDVETGHAVYDKWTGELDCPTLGANIIDTRTGKPYAKPYVIMERQGVRIAVLGMLTPAIPNFLNQALWQGMRFEDIVSSARRWVRHLKEAERADVVVGLFHSGWTGGIVTPDYVEDATRLVAEQVEGFDVIFFGHDHSVFNSTVNGVLCMNPANNALNVAEATVTCTKENGRWTVSKRQGQIVDITQEAIDSAFVSHFQPQINQVREFVERQIGTFTATVSSGDSFFGPAPFTDLIHEVQLAETRAEISLTAPLVFDTEIKAGPVYMSDLFKLYRYENQIYVMRLTGREVRQVLEMSYGMWTNTMRRPDDHIMRLSGDTQGNEKRRGFIHPIYNFDSAAGIDYEVDVTRPDGEKVRILQMSSGKPFDEKAWYRVAVNSYRGNGGGELLTRGAGIPLDSIPGRIEWMSRLDQRYYLMSMIERRGSVSPQSYGNWRFVPESWARPAIERDRKILFPHLNHY